MVVIVVEEVVVVVIVVLVVEVVDVFVVVEVVELVELVLETFIGNLTSFLDILYSPFIYFYSTVETRVSTALQ